MLKPDFPKKRRRSEKKEKEEMERKKKGKKEMKTIKQMIRAGFAPRLMYRWIDL